MPLANVADQPLPERQWRGVVIVDREDGDAVLDPEQHGIAQGIP